MSLPARFSKVTDSLYRSGQPQGPDFDTLAGLGIRTIVKLNEPAWGNYTTWRGELVRMPMRDPLAARATAPTPVDLSNVLSALQAAVGYGPTIVHCTSGVDRTGLVVAMYRTVACGWTKQAAWDEWVAMGSHNAPGLVAAWQGWQP